MDNTRRSTNEEIFRARVLIAQLKLNHKKALELTHTLRNSRTVNRLLLDEIQTRRIAPPISKPF
jgi:hypothetical protein